MSSRSERYFLVINRSQTDPVCCVRWRGSAKSLLEALAEPWLYWPPKIQLMLAHYSNLPRTLSSTSLRTYKPFIVAEFDSRESFRQSKKNIERGDPLRRMPGLIRQLVDPKNDAPKNQPNGRRQKLTESEVRAIKADQAAGLSHSQVAEKHRISASLSKLIKTNRRHAEVE